MQYGPQKYLAKREYVEDCGRGRKGYQKNLDSAS